MGVQENETQSSGNSKKTWWRWSILILGSVMITGGVIGVVLM